MKIQAAKIDNFILNQLTKLDSALLYGPDDGLIASRKDKIIEQILGADYDQMMISKFSSDKILKDPGILLSEVNAISLIPGRRLLLIDNASAKISKIITEALEAKNTDYFILVISGELVPSSSLRKYYESEEKSVALPCYVDDAEMVYQISARELEPLSPSHDILNFIAHNISGNRLILMNELAKIKLYCQDKDGLNFEDLENILALTNDADFQDLANAVAFRNPERSCSLLENLLDQGFPAITLIRVMINYMQRILQVRLILDDGDNFFNACKSLQPPVFFKQKDILQKHVNLWRAEEIKQLLQKLENLELFCKSNSIANANNLVKFFFLIVAKPKNIR